MNLKYLLVNTFGSTSAISSLLVLLLREPSSLTWLLMDFWIKTVIK